MSARCARWLAVSLLAASCAAPAARPDPRAARFAGADAERARQLAPDLYGRAERAHARALASEDDPAARADFEQQAAWLLQAAIAEAGRIEHERAAAASEARAAAAAHTRARLEHERIALDQLIRREQTARAERAHAAHGFTDWAFVLRRAQLLLAAASALGLPEAEAREVDAAIATAQRAAPARSLAAAHAALRDAERALGAARARSGAPQVSATETAALVEMAHEHGLAARATARGVALELGPLFAAGSAQLSAAGRAALSQLSALAAAHPRGALLIEYPEGGSGQLARARARRVQQQLATGDARSRVAVAPAPAGAAPADAPQLLFAAYTTGS